MQHIQNMFVFFQHYAILQQISYEKLHLACVYVLMVMYPNDFNFLCTGTIYGYYCTHNQYRCDHRNYIYDYYSNYNDGTWGCINSTLACNGELDCRFDRSDEQGCGMLEMILLPLELACIHLIHVEYMYIHVLSTQRWGERICEFQGSITVA